MSATKRGEETRGTLARPKLELRPRREEETGPAQRQPMRVREGSTPRERRDGAGLRARLREGEDFHFPIFKPFLFSFFNPNSNMIQIKFKYTFQDENFWEVSKTELLQTFENSFIFQFSFSFLFFFQK